MNSFHAPPTQRAMRMLAAGLCLLVLGACSALKPSATPQPVFYTLDSAARPAAAAPPATAPTLLVSPPRAAAGFDSARIIYVREPHRLEYFAHSEWVDPPARMLGPLLVDAAQRSGVFRAVVLAPGSATGSMRLDTEIVRLQHDFQTRPSRVRFTLRATVVHERTRAVLAWRELDASIPSTSDDPYGGVVAANQAVQAVLDQLAELGAEAARKLPPVVQ